MKRFMRLSVILILAAICILGIFVIVKATGNFFSYGQPRILDCQLNSSGNKLYASYYSDNAIVEINTSTMVENRRISVSRPTFLSLSADNNYLYSISSAWPSYLKRIRLSDLQISSIEIEGYAVNLTIDGQNQRLWIVGGVWPTPNSYISEDDVADNPLSGRLIEIDLTNFIVVKVTNIAPVPVSVLYSGSSNFLYVLHEGKTTQINGASEDDWIIANTVHVYDADTYQEVDEFFGGKEAVGTFPPIQLTTWDADSKYLAIPDIDGYPLKSFRVVNLLDYTNYFDLQLNDEDEFPLGFKFAHKAPNSEFLWAVAFSGVHDMSLLETGCSVARINTITHEYEFFTLDGVTTQVGDFAVSPDGNTLYIPVIDTGEIVVWSPD